MDNLFKVLQKYQGLSYICGVNDCNLMMLEINDFDTSKVPQFRTIREGRNALIEATGSPTQGDYLLSQGYLFITPYEATDGAVFSSGIHCFIYYNGMLFGVMRETNTFGFMSFDINNLSKFKIYKRS